MDACSGLCVEDAAYISDAVAACKTYQLSVYTQSRVNRRTPRAVAMDCHGDGDRFLDAYRTNNHD